MSATSGGGRGERGSRYDADAGAASLAGRVCVVPGANRGIGKATALGLARRGAPVVLLARDARRGAEARDEVRRASGGGDVSLVTADLASLASVRAAAAELAARHDALHVLVNNAGVNLARRVVTADGLEATLAVNHLAPFLLTTLLLPQLRRGAAERGDARVVTVSSEFERFGRIDFDDLQGERRYVGLLAYTQSKLANVLFTYALATRLEGSGVVAHCAYPGLVATDLLRDRWLFRAPALRALWSRVLLTPEEGARASLHAATAPELGGVNGASGRCVDRRGRLVRTSRRSYDVEARERLWRVSEELTGLAAERERRAEAG